MTLAVYNDPGCLQWPWLYTMTLAVYNDPGCLQWHWLSTVTLAVYSDPGCLQWPWLSTMTLAVYSNPGCLQWPWLSTVTLAVYNDTGCLQWPWLSTVTLAVYSYPGCHSDYNVFYFVLINNLIFYTCWPSRKDWHTLEFKTGLSRVNLVTTQSCANVRVGSLRRGKQHSESTQTLGAILRRWQHCHTTVTLSHSSGRLCLAVPGDCTGLDLPGWCLCAVRRGWLGEGAVDGGGVGG